MGQGGTGSAHAGEPPLGYTRYLTQRRDFDREEWGEVTADVLAILADAQARHEIAICDAAATPFTRAEVSAEHLAFNGTDVGDQGHETFALARVRVLEPWQQPKHLGWDACKTARKPHDRAVTAVLCYLATVVESHVVTSDGSGSDFLAELALARQALPRYANRLDIPMEVLAADRWCGPYVHVASRRHAFRFCVDRCVYCVYLLDGEGRSLFRFASHFEAARWLDTHREPGPAGGRLFNPRGAIDQLRAARLGRAQDAAFAALIASGIAAGAAPERRLQPPAFVRPGDLPPVEAASSLDALLAAGDAA